MIASEIISKNIPPLKISDSGTMARTWMTEFKITHLPVVDNKKYMGLISEDDIVDFNQPEDSLKEHIKNLYRPFVYDTEHIYEVLRIASQINSPIVPVIDHDEQYIGLISMDSLIHYFARISGITDPGGIIILEMPSLQDYLLSDIARIVEANNANILSLYINSSRNSSRITVTIKVNTTDIKHIIATFERYEYTIQAYFQESDMKDILKNRYDALMNYLNI